MQRQHESHHRVIALSRNQSIALSCNQSTLSWSSTALQAALSEGACTVSVGGTECSECALVDCGDDYWGIKVACGNIETGANYNKEGFSIFGKVCNALLVERKAYRT